MGQVAVPSANDAAGRGAVGGGGAELRVAFRVRALPTSGTQAAAAAGVVPAAGPAAALVRAAAGGLATEVARVPSVLCAVRRGLAPGPVAAVLPRAAPPVVLVAVEGRLAAVPDAAPPAAPAAVAVAAAGTLATAAARAAPADAHGGGGPRLPGAGTDFRVGLPLFRRCPNRGPCRAKGV